MSDWLAFNGDAVVAYFVFGLVFAFGNEIGHMIKRTFRLVTRKLRG